MWTGHLVGWGYGQVKSGGKIRMAHRVSYETHIGPIPPGMLVCHHCDRPACINPAHLFIGTHKDNVADMMAKGRDRFRGGRRPWNAKFTPEQIRRIRADTRSLKRIGRDYGVHHTTILRLKRGSVYRDVS